MKKMPKSVKNTLEEIANDHGHNPNTCVGCNAVAHTFKAPGEERIVYKESPFWMIPFLMGVIFAGPIGYFLRWSFEYWPH